MLSSLSVMNKGYYYCTYARATWLAHFSSGRMPPLGLFLVRACDPASISAYRVVDVQSIISRTRERLGLSRDGHSAGDW